MGPPVSFGVVFEILATLAAGAFAGAALYINAVEHPASMKRGVAITARGFSDWYERAAAFQAPLAVAALVTGTLAWLTGSSGGWLAGALVIGAVVPYTLLVIGPTTNRRLVDPDLDGDSDAARTLLLRWAWLHALRSALSTAAFVLFVWLLAAG